MSLLQGLGNQAPEPMWGGAPIRSALDHPGSVDRLLSAAWSQGAEECAHTIQELSADSLPAGAAVG